MTYQPILPASGYTGWVFLQRTMEVQKEAFVDSAQVRREMSYFREKIAMADTAEKLVADRRLLSVALGAFGLDDDINARAFIRKVLEEGTIKEGAFANRLADKRYSELAIAFGYGDLGSRTNLSTFADQILSRYEDRQFERAVGDVDPSMRQALALGDTLGDIVRRSSTDRGQWFSLMGNRPARALMETALGLPGSIGSLDLDQQVEAFRDRARTVFGTSDLAEIAGDAELQDKAIRLFLVREQVATFRAQSGASVALSLLQAGR
ncbi:DUF1217 domain-containing protein [Wenxinia saemankumensis]|uniref:Flagellar protein n=1 Tax=Wenxinia saemankumensis TaxID=1447782 RepID=A0A1M6G5Q7_9RHOB|nr:DUF1217 domain-containing protein [Wenxinia saemankumensis]SHJ05271.1 Protein of unknown function [Wenxinia saemankumensis]